MLDDVELLLSGPTVRMCIGKRKVVAWTMFEVFRYWMTELRIQYKWCTYGQLSASNIVNLSTSLEKFRWFLHGMGTYVNRTIWLHVWCFHMLEFAQLTRNLQRMDCSPLEAVNGQFRVRFLGGPRRGGEALVYAHDTWSMCGNLLRNDEEWDEELWREYTL